VGNATNVKNHIRREHHVPTNKKEVNAVKYGRILDCYERSDDAKCCLDMFGMDETFFVSTRLIESNLYFCLQHTGLRNKNPSYDYEVSIYKEDGSGSFSARDKSKPLLNYSDKIIEEDDCAVFVPQHWKNCVHEENVLLYKIEVSKNCSM
jgi:hypothetical protein